MEVIMADPTNTTTIPGNRGCVSCGASNPAKARYCAQCGASMPPQTTGGTKADLILTDARQHLLLQHWEEAALAAEASLALAPDSAEAHHIAAVARLKQGMRATAERHATRAVELDGGVPEYHATLLQAQGMTRPPFEWNRPGVVASIAAGLMLILVVGVLIANRDKDRPSTLKMQQSVPTGPVSPFIQSQGGGASYPQPSRPSGSSFGKPRIAARSAAPGPSDLTSTTDSNARSSLPAGFPSTAQSGAVGLAPATPPVDTTPLNRFGSPDSSTQTRTAPRRNDQPAVTQPAPNRVVVPPPAQAGGGTLFGGTGFGPVATMPSAPAPETDTTPSETSAAPQASRGPASPHEAYLQRDYGTAIQGFLKRIRNGDATGSNYQQLGFAYDRVGDRLNAIAAYRAAVKAYEAQIQSGADTDLATRGLRNTRKALARLEAK
jgi:tetratricopeptide (TPR) repeat protein